MRTKLIPCLAFMFVLTCTSTIAAERNLLADGSFENGILRLPGLGAVVDPPGFNPGFWGVERAGEVCAERGVRPIHLIRMLYMENEGLTVTQAYQAVDVSAFACLIDSGRAFADFRAAVNTYLSNQVFVPGLLFFDANQAPLGNWFGSMPVDATPKTWENFATLHPIPVGTRWIIVQLGYRDAYLPFGERAYVDAVYLDVVCRSCQ